MRSGYTTGACAAAAAKAAALALLNQKAIDQVEITLPAGQRVSFDISRCEFNSLKASCSVIKDGGGDPDVTDGAEICAAVSWEKEPGVSVQGGKGVGLVTKPGLEIPVGMAAINPVPRTMISQSVQEVIGAGKGVEVTISVPRGEELAKKTLNRRLGIVGGISIIGTSGMVMPYSVEAYKVSISQTLDVAMAAGCSRVVLTTGRRSEKFARREFPLAEEAFILMGDFVGHALEECARRKVVEVIIWGMVGKLSKVANGDFYTNVSDSRIDVDFLAGIAADCGVTETTLVALRGAVTAHHFLRILGAEHAGRICDRLCYLAAAASRRYVNGRFDVECVMSDYNGAIIGRGNDKG